MASILQANGSIWEYEVDNKKLKSILKEKEKDLKKKDEEILRNNQEIEELNRKITELVIKNEDRKAEIDELEKKIKRLQDINDHLKKEIQTLKKELNDEKASSCELRDRVENLEKNVDSHMLFIAQLAFQFRENAYYIVMGENYDDYYPEYSLAKMEIKIYDIRDDTRRRNAEKNWDKFQADFQWSPEKAEVLEQLRRLRNEVAHPGDLDKTKALEAIDELHKQNKLRGLIKKDKVKNVVDMWEMSCNMAKYATLYD